MFKRGDLNPVARALHILHALRGYPEGRSIAQLAREAGVSERTVKRDLTDLSESNIKIDRTPIDGRAAARLEEESHHSVAITRRERYTLLAIRRMFDPFKGTPLAEDVESVLAKVQQRASAKERADFAADRDRFAFVPVGGVKHYRDKEDVLDALLSGVLLRRVVRYAYRGGRGRASRGYFAPFAMVLFKQGFYVIGRKLDGPADGLHIAKGKPTLLAAERFTEAEHLRSHAFVVPSDFRLDDYLVSAFEIYLGEPEDLIRVVVEFSKERAVYAKAREWHREQTVHEMPDGAVQISFTCSNLAPVVSWVLEWGPQARAVSPPALVEAVMADLDAARAQYRQRRVS